MRLRRKARRVRLSVAADILADIMNLEEIKAIVAGGESETVEFKKSTAQLPRVGETLCAFLNRSGGILLIGVTPDGRIVGQQVSDKTRREIAAMLDQFEPTPSIEVSEIAVPRSSRKVIALSVTASEGGRPSLFAGRPYQRI